MCNVYWVGNKDSIYSPNGGFVTFETEFQSEIYPNRLAPIFKKSGNDFIIEASIWGLPPPPNINRPITNVRNLSSPFWQSILNNKQNRCLVPASAFCEWTGEKGSKQKVWFGLESEEQFFFAGVCSLQGNKSNYAFLTTEPNELIRPIHPKSMPVILTPDLCDIWLNASINEIKNLAKPYGENHMKIFESNLIN